MQEGLSFVREHLPHFKTQRVIVSAKVESSFKDAESALASIQHLKQLYLMGLANGLDDLTMQGNLKTDAVYGDWNEKVQDFLSNLVKDSKIVSPTSSPSVLDIISVSPESIISRRRSGLSSHSCDSDTTTSTLSISCNDIHSSRRRHVSTTDSIPASDEEIQRRKKLKLQLKYALNKSSKPNELSNKTELETVPSFLDKRIDNFRKSIDLNLNTLPPNIDISYCDSSIPTVSPLPFNSQATSMRSFSNSACAPPIIPDHPSLLNKVSSILNDITQMLGHDNSTDNTPDLTQSDLKIGSFSTLSVDTACLPSCSSKFSSISLPSSSTCDSPLASANAHQITPNSHNKISPVLSASIKVESPSSICNYIETITGLQLKASSSALKPMKPPLFDNKLYHLVPIKLTNPSPVVKSQSENIDWKHGFHGRHILNAPHHRRIPLEPLYLNRPIKSNNQPEVIPTDRRVSVSSDTVIYNKPSMNCLDIDISKTISSYVNDSTSVTSVNNDTNLHSLEFKNAPVARELKNTTT